MVDEPFDELDESEDTDEDPHSTELPVEQRALNIIGLAQAREQLQAAREGKRKTPAKEAEDAERRAAARRHPSAHRPKR